MKVAVTRLVLGAGLIAVPVVAAIRRAETRRGLGERTISAAQIRIKFWPTR